MACVPQGALATGSLEQLATGDRVTHNGQTWESTIDDNVWEPGVHGWVVV